MPGPNASRWTPWLAATRRRTRWRAVANRRAPSNRQLQQPSNLAQMIVAFLSTGRCGTQWLASGFATYHPDLEVEHEPIGVLYKPRRYFRCYRHPEAVL